MVEKCLSGHEFTAENTRRTKRGWRVCIACKREKDREYRQKADNAKRSAEYSKEWRKNNQARSRELALRHYDSIREIIEAAKDVPCMDCGRRYPHYVMDFDHRDPATKTMNVGLTRSKQRTIEEIKKCDVVCANCHRIRTWRGRSRGR